MKFRNYNASKKKFFDYIEEIYSLESYTVYPEYKITGFIIKKNKYNKGELANLDQFVMIVNDYFVKMISP